MHASKNCIIKPICELTRRSTWIVKVLSQTSSRRVRSQYCTKKLQSVSARSFCEKVFFLQDRSLIFSITALGAKTGMFFFTQSSLQLHERTYPLPLPESKCQQTNDRAENGKRKPCYCSRNRATPLQIFLLIPSVLALFVAYFFVLHETTIPQCYRRTFRQTDDFPWEY